MNKRDRAIVSVINWIKFVYVTTGVFLYGVHFRPLLAETGLRLIDKLYLFLFTVVFWLPMTLAELVSKVLF